MKIKDNIINALIGTTLWSIIIIAIVLFIIYKEYLIGPVVLLLGVFIILSLLLFGRDHKSVWPDVLFGMIDNGALVVLALIGASFLGTLGAIVGGAVGNAITDGFAGIFEGHSAKENVKKGVKDERSPVSTAFGKMAGCLIAMGLVLTIAWTILRILI